MGDIAESVVATTHDKHGNVEGLDKLNTIGVTLNTEIEATQAITRKGICAALQDDSA